jgi:hypothetical protein
MKAQFRAVVEPDRCRTADLSGSLFKNIDGVGTTKLLTHIDRRRQPGKRCRQSSGRGSCGRQKIHSPHLVGCRCGRAIIAQFRLDPPFGPSVAELQARLAIERPLHQNGLPGMFGRPNLTNLLSFPGRLHSFRRTTSCSISWSSARVGNQLLQPLVLLLELLQPLHLRR